MKLPKRFMHIRIRPVCYIVFPAALLLIPLRFVFAFCFAAAIHEIGHYLVLRLLGVRIDAVSVGPAGALIETEPMSRMTELITTAAGPVTGLLPLLFYRYVPVLALFASVQSIYNLLPIYPHDGGRIVACICSGSKVGRLIQQLLILLTYCALCMLSFVCADMLQMGIVPIVAVFIFIVRNLGRKTPCNQ